MREPPAFKVSLALASPDHQVVIRARLVSRVSQALKASPERQAARQGSKVSLASKVSPDHQAVRSDRPAFKASPASKVKQVLRELLASRASPACVERQALLEPPALLVFKARRAFKV